MKNRIVPSDTMAHEFRLLRNRIEAEVPSPGLVFVTSATAGDGAGFTAFGLAESLGNAHQRAVLVTGDATLAASRAPAPPDGRRRPGDRSDGMSHTIVTDTFSVVTVSSDRLATVSRASVGEMLQNLRAANDYIVIDAGNLPQNSFGLLLAGSANATLVAFRSGRPQHDDDRAMIEILEHAEAKVLGVVMTDQLALDAFHRRQNSGGVVEPIRPSKRTAFLTERFELALSRLGRSS